MKTAKLLSFMFAGLMVHTLGSQRLSIGTHLMTVYFIVAHTHSIVTSKLEFALVLEFDSTLSQSKIEF